MMVVAEAARLAGVDNIHIGTVIGKLAGDKNEVLPINDHIEKQNVKEDKKLHLLGEKWGKMKPVMSASSGGLHPGLVPEILSMLGNDIAIQIGGGTHGHPKGTIAGAKAVMQAIDASMNNISLKEYAKTHKELQQALDTWGFIRPK